MAVQRSHRPKRAKKRAAARKNVEPTRRQSISLGEKLVLQAITWGEPLLKRLESLVRVIEEQSRAMLCSILLLDEDGKTLRYGAAPSLPESYNRAIDGLTIGPSVGSCGTAAYRKESVIVTDIARDPLWTNCRDLALSHGLRACWSSPIVSSDGKVLGTFAMYYRKPRSPNGKEMELIRFASHLAGIAITKSRADEEAMANIQAATAAEAKFRGLVETAPDAIVSVDREGRMVFVNSRTEKIFGYSRDELLGKPVEMLVPERFRDRHVGHRADYISQPRIRLMGVWDIMGRRKDGSEVPVDIALSPVETDGGILVTAIIRDITERKQAEETLKLRTSQQMTVAVLGQRALAGTDLFMLMDEVISRVAETLKVDYCKVLELLPDGKALLLRAGVGWKDGYVGRATVGAGADSQAGYTLLSAEPVIVDDLRTETRFRGPPLLHEHGVVSGMSVIISGKDRPFGVLGAHTTKQRTFSTDDIHFLQATANVLAEAIERKRAEEALQARYQELQTLHEIGQIVLKSLDLQTTVEGILDKAIALGPFDIGVIRLLDLSNRVLKPVALRGYQDPNNVSEITVELDSSRAGPVLTEVLSSKEAHVVENVPLARGLQPFKKEGVQSAIVVPVRAQEQVLGAIQLGSRVPRKFEPHKVRLLETIGNQLGIAVQKNRLYEETHQNLERIRALREMDLAITSTLDLRTILDILLEKIDRLLPFVTATTVRLLNRETGELAPVACRNLDKEEWKVATAGATARGLGRMLSEKNTPVMVLNVQTDPRSLAPQFLRKYGLVSSLRVPLVAKKEVLGALTFFTKEEHQFTDEEVGFLTTLAGQAGLAIQNSQLYEEMAKLAGDLAKSNKVKDEFLSVMSHELRTPLNVVMGYTGMIKDRVLGEINPQQEEALSKVISRANDQLAIVNNILHATVFETEKIKIESHEVGLGDFLNQFRSVYEAPINKELTLN
ncbi:GAF domain-containing protein, partial [bacterium]